MSQRNTRVIPYAMMVYEGTKLLSGASARGPYEICRLALPASKSEPLPHHTPSVTSENLIARVKFPF